MPAIFILKDKRCEQGVIHYTSSDGNIFCVVEFFHLISQFSTFGVNSLCNLDTTHFFSLAEREPEQFRPISCARVAQQQGFLEGRVGPLSFTK